MLEALHNLEAERYVLGSVASQGERVMPEIAGLLTPDDFVGPRHPAYWRAALELSGAGQGVNAFGMADKVGVKPDELLAMANEAFAPVVMAPAQARIVADKAVLRRLLGATGEIAERLKRPGENVEDVIAHAHELVTGIALRRLRPEVSTFERVQRALDLIEQRREAGGKLTGVPTGIDVVDELTGGLRPGGLVIVAARTSLGKTAFTAQVAMRLAVDSGLPALFVTTEDSAEAITDRWLANLGRVDMERIGVGDLDLDHWKRVQDAGIRLAKSPVRVEEANRLADITSLCRRWRAKNQDPKALIVVDYLQRIQVDHRKGENREREVARIADGLKSLAQELACPVIAPCQLSRGVESDDREPRLSDLRESGSLEQDADLVLFLSRDRYVADSEASLMVAKNRHGRTGKRALRWVGAFQLFENLPAYEAPEERRYADD